MTDWTHEALVERSAAWLRSTKKCKWVIVHSARYDEEHPDAIGWLRTGESIVVEAKMSMADLGRDGRKPWRMSSNGMGMWKFYLLPPDIMTPEAFHEYRLGRWWCNGSGLLTVRGNRLIEAVRAEPRQTRDWAAEIRLLVYGNGRPVAEPERSA